LGGAGDGDLAEESGGGDHVTGEENAVAAVDSGAVAPGVAGRVQGAGEVGDPCAS